VWVWRIRLGLLALAVGLVGVNAEKKHLPQDAGPALVQLQPAVINRADVVPVSLPDAAPAPVRSTVGKQVEVRGPLVRTQLVVAAPAAMARSAVAGARHGKFASSRHGKLTPKRGLFSRSRSSARFAALPGRAASREARPREPVPS
jgi:hypothetical protein